MATDDRQRLLQQIREWNMSRLDMFALSEPNQDLEFFGVMRFFYQDEEEKVSTKCIRVSSTATTKDVLCILIEKFRPDLRMLTPTYYALYEVHISGEERKLQEYECPLLVQLNWGKDDREGRFLLKRESDKTTAWSGLSESSARAAPAGPGLERKLSRREKKELKKREKEAQLHATGDKENIASKLYTAAPDSSFTRSISNPEMVMRRRRQMKLERKLQEIHTSSNGPNSGGTLKIYGENINKDVPYKTLLLSTSDTVASIIRETLDKYGLEKVDDREYCLVQVVHPTNAEEFYGKQCQEFVLEDDDCPLELLSDLPATCGPVTFHLRRRLDGRYGSSVPQLSSEPVARFHQQAPAAAKSGGISAVHQSAPEPLPYLVELNHDGREPLNAQTFVIPVIGLEIGLEKSAEYEGYFLRLNGQDICRQHCLITYVIGKFVVAPLDRSAAIWVDGTRIHSSTELNHGAVLRIGQYHFRFIDPVAEQKRTTPTGALDRTDNKQHALANQKHIGGGRPGSSHFDLFPATVDYRDDAEDQFLRSLISEINIDILDFKLVPTYVIYMAVRHKLMPYFKPDMPGNERLRQVSMFVSKISNIIYQTSQRSQNDAVALAIWMANASELLHLFSRDMDIKPISIKAQNLLAECVQMTFLSLVDCLQHLLNQVMPAFLDPNPQPGEVAEDDLRQMPQSSGPIVDNVIGLLSSTMSLLLQARVNAALTIQLFSQLFHFINMWLFNRLVARDSNLCSRAFAWTLRMRLNRVEVWAEKQGLELAAECHLARILQAVTLLESLRKGPGFISELGSTYVKLNSIQVRVLLQNYRGTRDEPPIKPDLIERAVSVAQNSADILLMNEDIKVKLLEDVDLHLPFLLPEDGYSCDFVTGLLPELISFLEPLQRSGICRVLENPKSPGTWTVFLGKPENITGRCAFPMVDDSGPQSGSPAMLDRLPSQPQVVVVTLNKIKNSIGLSIIEASGDDGRDRSIFVKSVIPDGAAARDGRIQGGDQLLEVDGVKLSGLNQDQAADVLISTGQTVTLTIAKQAALYHGLNELLDRQPSPLSAGAGYRNQQFAMPQHQQPPSQQHQQMYPQHGASHPSDLSNSTSNIPIYAEPHAARAGLAGSGRSRSASNLAQTKTAHAEPSRPVGMPSHYPQSRVSPQLPSSKSFEDRGQRGFGSSQMLPDGPTPYVPVTSSADAFRSDSLNRRQNINLGPQSSHQQAPTVIRQPSAGTVLQTEPWRSNISPPKQVPDRMMEFERQGQPSGHGGTLPQTEQWRSNVSPPKQVLDRMIERQGQPPGRGGTLSQTEQWRSNVSPPKQVPDRTMEFERQGQPPGRGGTLPQTEQWRSNVSPPKQIPNRTMEFERQNQAPLYSQTSAGLDMAGGRQQAYMSQPDLSVTDHQMYTSQDLLLRAQPGRRTERPVSSGYGGYPTSSEVGHGAPDRRSVPVGGHLRAIDTKSIQPSGTSNARPSSESETRRPQVYYREPQATSEFQATSVPAPRSSQHRSQSLPRGLKPVTANPWEHERKEEERRRQESELRLQRDREIAQLESIPPQQLTQDEADRLHRLKVNAEFDRRAEELEQGNSLQADNDTDMTPAGRVKVVKQMQQEVNDKRRQLHQQLENRERQFAEAEYARAQEEKKQMEQIQQTESYLQQASDRGGGMKYQTSAPPAPQPGIYPYRGSSHESAEPVRYAYSRETNTNNNNANLPPPPPPERGSSFGYQGGPKKTVSFRPDVEVKAEEERSSPDRQVPMNSTQLTPGVVGSQELYLDPRDRKRALQGSDAQQQKTPERMSFRDKMRHFATEAGEDTPVERPKISRAQQLIEMNLVK